MFVEAIVLLSAIIGGLLTLSIFIFHMTTRATEGRRENVRQIVDNVTDAALDEINRLSRLILDELDEKHNSLLFMYQLMDDKKKELESINTRLDTETEVDTSFIHQGAKEIPSPKIVQNLGINRNQTINVLAHYKYLEIKELQNKGLSAQEIARQLGIGQGEVKLIIGLIGR